VEGHAGHRDRLARRFAPCGQRDVQQAGGFLRVVEEQLVEIAHAVEQQESPDAAALSARYCSIIGETRAGGSAARTGWGEEDTEGSIVMAAGR